MLTPDQLALLFRIQRSGSLAAAGRELEMTPAAISLQVARMETEVGASLIERHARGARLTKLGRALSDEGESILHSTLHAHQIQQVHLDNAARQLHVGALSSTIRPVVSDALAHIRLKYPTSQLRVMEVGSREGIELVRNLEIDLAVVAEYEQPSDFHGVVHQELTQDPILVAVPDDHPVAPGGAVSLRELSNMDWVSGGEGQQHRLQLEWLAEKAGFVPSIVFETQSFEVALSMVGAGIAAALIPYTAWQHTPGARLLRVETAPSRRLYAITHPTLNEAQLTMPMLKALDDVVANLSELGV